MTRLVRSSVSVSLLGCREAGEAVFSLLLNAIEKRNIISKSKTEEKK